MSEFGTLLPEDGICGDDGDYFGLKKSSLRTGRFPPRMHCRAGNYNIPFR
jgi:hypothetical protein